MEQINRIRKKPLSDAELQIVRQMEADSRLGNQPADLSLETSIQAEGEVLSKILEEATPLIDDTASIEVNVGKLQEKYPDAVIVGKVLETRIIPPADADGTTNEAKLSVQTEITIAVNEGQVVLQITPPDFPPAPVVTGQVFV